MLLRIVAVYDRQALSFHQPIYVAADVMAVRSFKAACNDKNSESDFYQNPQDYKLMSLGTFDDSTGVLVQDEPPKLLFDGREISLARQSVTSEVDNV